MIDENNRENWIYKISSLFYQDKYDEALVSVNDALKLFPKDLDILEYKAYILEDLNDNENLLGVYNEILQINPQYWGMLRAKADTYEELGDLDNAIKTYDEALSYYIDDYFLLEDKLKCLYNFGRIDDAHKLISEILNKYPDDSNLWNIIAIIYNENNEYEKSIDAYDTALDLELCSAYMNNKVICLLEMYGFGDSSEIYGNLFDIIREYDRKFIYEPEPVRYFGVCEGIKIIDFKSQEEYFEYIGCDLNE